MNSYSRGYGRRRYGAYRRRYGYGRSWRRNWYRSGGSRAGAMQRNGRRSFVLSVPVDMIYTLTVEANKNYSTLLRTVPWLHFVGASDTNTNRCSSAQSLFSNAAYRMYTKLYDQMKIVSVQHHVYVCNPVGVSGGLPSMKVYTSWDRDLHYGDGTMTADDLLNGPESQSQMFVTNSRAEFVRYVRASDLQEKTTFHDCSMSADTTNYYRDNAWANCGLLGFSPSMTMMFETSDTNAADRSFQVNISSRYLVVFRNPKFGLSNYQPSNAKMDLKFSAEEVSDVKNEVVSDEVKKDVGDLGDDDVLINEVSKEA